jgi:ribosomal protein L22
VQLKELVLKLRNKMTEKDYNPEQRNAKAMQKQEKMKSPEIAPVKKVEKKKDEEKNQNVPEKKVEKKPVKIVKKTEAIANGKSLPISTKDSMAICKFIKKKSIEKAIADLQEVLMFKKAIPMKGEIPHRKGKIMSGRYPINAVKEFIRLLKNLLANSNVNGLEEPIIAEAVPNKASRPYGRFGSIKRKRTHIKIIVKEKSKLKKGKKK